MGNESLNLYPIRGSNYSALDPRRWSALAEDEQSGTAANSIALPRQGVPSLSIAIPQYADEKKNTALDFYQDSEIGIQTRTVKLNPNSQQPSFLTRLEESNNNTDMQLEL